MARTQAQLLVRAARRDTSSVGAIFRWQRWSFQVFMAGVGVYTASSVGVATVELFRWWHKLERASRFIEIICALLLLMAPLFLAAFLMGFEYTRKFGASLWALRPAAAVGDDALMAPVSPQPVSGDPTTPQPTSHEFANVRWLDEPLAARIVTVCRLDAFAWLPLYFTGSFWLLLFPAAISTVVVTTPVYAYPVIVVLYMALILAPLKKSKMFLLDTGAAILAWGYEPMYTLFGESMTNDTPDLVRLIVTHTHLILRDATPLTAEIAEKAGGVNGRFWRRMLAPQRGARPAATIAGLDDVLRPPRRERLRAWSLVGLAFTPLIAYLVVIAISMSMRP